jgi:ABC-type nickel/cobalt efflux system permease component RcnA
MTATVVGALVTAGLLGATHAVEPDHVAGISSLTGRYDDARLSALVGVCFGAGHVALVVVWLGLAYLVFGRSSFPAALDTLGTLAVAVVLAGLGAVLTIRGYRAAARTHARASHDSDRGYNLHGDPHGDHGHSHADPDGHRGHSHGTTGADPHLHLPGFDTHDHDHTTRAYLRTGLVGALFTLSPPLSMMAFAGALIPTYGFGAVALAVVVYTVTITLTMAAVGAGVGTVFHLAERFDRAYGALRVGVGVVVVGFAVTLFAETLGLV